MASLNADFAALLDDIDHLTATDVFDLSGPLGDSLISSLTHAIRDSFDHEVDPDGVPWPVLSSDYARYKEQHYPGENILVRDGPLRAGIDGEPTQAPDVAIYTYGTDAINRAEATFAQEGDPLANRPQRRFVDLTPDALTESDRLFDEAFSAWNPR